MFEVEIFSRDGQGQWFGRGARRYRSLPEAYSAFHALRRERWECLDNGYRIDLRRRAGRQVIASVGGRLENAKVARYYPADGIWYVFQTSAGWDIGQKWEDVPIPNDREGRGGRTIRGWVERTPASGPLASREEAVEYAIGIADISAPLV